MRFPARHGGLHALTRTCPADAFYAPLLLRIHIVNRYLSPAVDFIDLETAFPVMHMWAAKVAQWTLFTTTVLGPDYGAELVVHYR